MNKNLEPLHSSIVKLLGAIGTENNDQVKRMLEDLLTNLKEKQNGQNPPETTHDQTKKRLKDEFNYKDCYAFQQITQVYFFPTIRLRELVSIAMKVADRCNLRLGRNEKRLTCFLFKWFDDNWEVIEPHMKMIKVYNKEGDVLN